MITVQCKSCGTRYGVQDKFAGSRAKCKRCGTAVSIPHAADATVPAGSDLETILYNCPQCGGKLQNPGSMGGRRDKCPLCDFVHPVPLSQGQKSELKRQRAVEAHAVDPDPIPPGQEETAPAAGLLAAKVSFALSLVGVLLQGFAIIGCIISAGAFLSGIGSWRKSGWARAAVVIAGLNVAWIVIWGVVLANYEAETLRLLNSLDRERLLDSGVAITPVDAGNLNVVKLASVPYVNDEHGFSIRFPESWQLKGSTVTETVVKARLRDDKAPITFLSVAVYPALSTQNMPRLSAERLFHDYVVAGQEVEARMRNSGLTTLDGKPAVWMEVDVSAPLLYSGIFLIYFVPTEHGLYRVSGLTDRNETWFASKKATFEASIRTFHLTKPIPHSSEAKGGTSEGGPPKEAISLVPPQVGCPGRSHHRVDSRLLVDRDGTFPHCHPIIGTTAQNRGDR